MKTTQEILARIAEIEADDMFGFQKGDLLAFLPYDVAKPFLNEEMTQDKWATIVRPQTKEAAVGEMLNYMPFAWEKANDCRGISACRSVEHMKAWLWLAGDDLYDKLDDLYEFYGKPCLAVICEKYGWDWRRWDDGEWRNDESGPSQSAPVTVEVPG